MLSSVTAAEIQPENVSEISAQITAQLQILRSLKAEVLGLLDQYFCLEHEMKNMAVPILPSWTCLL